MVLIKIAILNNIISNLAKGIIIKINTLTLYYKYHDIVLWKESANTINQITRSIYYYLLNNIYEMISFWNNILRNVISIKYIWFLMISKKFAEFYLKIIGRYMIEEDDAIINFIFLS